MSVCLSVFYVVLKRKRNYVARLIKIKSIYNMFVLNILNVCFPGSRDENKVEFSIFFCALVDVVATILMQILHVAK